MKFNRGWIEILGGVVLLGMSFFFKVPFSNLWVNLAINGFIITRGVMKTRVQANPPAGTDAAAIAKKAINFLQVIVVVLFLIGVALFYKEITHELEIQTQLVKKAAPALVEPNLSALDDIAKSVFLDQSAAYVEFLDANNKILSAAGDSETPHMTMVEKPIPNPDPRKRDIGRVRMGFSHDLLNKEIFILLLLVGVAVAVTRLVLKKYRL